MENNKFEKVLSILDATGTNWSTEKKQLVSVDGETTGSYGMFRSDTKAWLGTAKAQYQPMNNSTIVEHLLDATDSLNLELKKGGMFSGGSKVYYQIELPTDYIGKSNIKRYITAINSHDGSTSIALGSSNVVVVCQNTFYKAYREMEKVRHTVTASARVQLIASNLRDTITMDEKLMTTFKRMADMPMKDEIVERLVKKLFAKTETTDKLADLPTRTKNNVELFANNLETEINLEGKTIWGLFNAVTRHTNHTTAPKNEEKKSQYLMSGSGMRTNNLAYDELMQWVEENTATLHFVTK